MVILGSGWLWLVDYFGLPGWKMASLSVNRLLEVPARRVGMESHAVDGVLWPTDDWNLRICWWNDLRMGRVTSYSDSCWLLTGGLNQQKEGWLTLNRLVWYYNKLWMGWLTNQYIEVGLRPSRIINSLMNWLCMAISNILMESLAILCRSGE